MSLDRQRQRSASQADLVGGSAGGGLDDATNGLVRSDSATERANRHRDGPKDDAGPGDGLAPQRPQLPVEDHRADKYDVGETCRAAPMVGRGWCGDGVRMVWG